MRLPTGPILAAVALLLSACAAQTVAPSNEEKRALAPTGKLRVAFFAANPAYAAKDPATGEFKGPTIDIGRQMAARLGVPFVAVPYPTIAEAVASAPKDEWDVVTLGVNPDRQKLIDFVAPHVQTESGYLVKGTAIATMADVDRPGVRVAVLERGDSDVFLTKLLKNATLIRVKAAPDALAMLNAGSADVHANVKTSLIPAVTQVPGGRILDGYWQIQTIAFGVPKGKEASVPFVRRTVEELKSQGFVRESVEKAGVRGLVASP